MLHQQHDYYLHNLSVVLVEKQVETQFQSYFMNISWSLSTDGSFFFFFFVQVAGGDPKESEKMKCRDAEGNVRQMP